MHRLLEEKKNAAEAGSTGIDFWDENTNKKIANSGDGGGRSNNRKKSKNDKTNPSYENQANRAASARPAVNATAVLDTRKRSIAEIERALHDLNEAARCHDEAAFEIAARDELLDQQASHNGLARAGIIQTKRKARVELNFFDYSDSKRYYSEPDVVEYNKDTYHPIICQILQILPGK